MSGRYGKKIKLIKNGMLHRNVLSVPCGFTAACGGFFQKNFLGVLTIFFFILCLATPAVTDAASITLAWQRNQEPDIAGYSIYYGTKSGVYTNSITVYDSLNDPLERTYKVDGIDEGTTYYFALKAFDTAAHMSTISPEVTVFVPPSEATYVYDVFDTRLFVALQYRDLLGREPDPSGLDFWQGLIDSGLLTRAQLIDTFMDCPEAQSSIASIIRLYLAYFKRLPDCEGLFYWCAQFGQGFSLGDISDYFSISPEFLSTYGDLDDSEYVYLLYRNVLEREPDTEGYAFWLNLLESRQVNRGTVMLLFSESEEFTRKTYSAVYVIRLFVGMLHRPPTIQDDFDHWMMLLEDGFPREELVNIFLESEEYLARFL